jgi:hypothetical protein
LEKYWRELAKTGSWGSSRVRNMSICRWTSDCRIETRGSEKY